ncbi:agmatine deiminase family protein [bacterium]|nr:agmatine deiminase family protein [bacterium]
MRNIIFALLCLLLISSSFAAPPQPVRQCAEWEPVEGVLIRWPLGISLPLVAEMSEDVIVYTLIRDYQINQATSAYYNNGVNMDNVEWVLADTYSHWTRDWGPQFVFDGNGDWGLGDPLFDGYPWVGRRGTSRGWEQDDDSNGEFASYLGVSNWEAPIVLTGGNHMTDGHGIGFCTQVQLDENNDWGISEAAWRTGLAQYFGIHDERVLPNWESYGIQHIDCVAKMLDEETILCKRLASGHSDYWAVEALVDELAAQTSCYGNPYRILRIDCGPFGGVAPAYTNSLILGKKVLLPFEGISQDAAAAQVYAEAMPGYEVIGFTGSWYDYDALHCRTMGVFDRGMLYVDVAPPPAEIPLAPWPVRAFIDDRSEAGLDYSACSLFWRRAGEAFFNEVPLMPMAAPDSLEAYIPGTEPGAEIEYYVQGADNSGRVETRPIAAPDALFSTRVDEDPTSVDVPIVEPRLVAWPNPFRGKVRFTLRGSDPVAEIDIYDLTGRHITTIPQGESMSWDGRHSSGQEASAGVYLYHSTIPGNSSLQKILMLD